MLHEQRFQVQMTQLSLRWCIQATSSQFQKTFQGCWGDRAVEQHHRIIWFWSFLRLKVFNNQEAFFSDNLIMFSIQRWLQRDICVFGGEPPAIGLQNNRGLEQYGIVQFSESWILLLGLYQDVWNSVWQLNSVIRNSILLLTDMKYIYCHNVLLKLYFKIRDISGTLLWFTDPKQSKILSLGLELWMVFWSTKSRNQRGVSTTAAVKIGRRVYQR